MVNIIHQRLVCIRESSTLNRTKSILNYLIQKEKLMLTQPKTTPLLSKEELNKSILAGSMTALSVICGIISFFWVMNIIEILKTTRDIKSIIFNLIVIVFILCIKAIFHSVGIKKSHKVAYSALMNIRNRIINHIGKLRIADINKRKTGELLQIINHDVDQIEVFMAHALPEVIMASVIPVTILVSLFVIQWQFAVILLAVIPILGGYLKWFSFKFGSLFGTLSKKQKNMSEDLLEYIAGISVVKAFNRDEKKTDALLERMDEYITWVKKITVSITIPGLTQNLIIASGVTTVILFGSKLLLLGSITSEHYIIGIVLSGFYTGSISKLMMFTHKSIMFSQSKKNIISILEIPLPELGKTSDEVLSGDITFSNVWFSYDGVKSVLNNISFTAKKNSSTCLIGSSGSGKTTITNLIAGFISTDNGDIYIGSSRINSISEGDLFDLVSIVEQDVFLFNLTIRENILIGNLNATDDQVIKAAKDAKIHDMIINLPGGYNTSVGEGGCRLSGGEKQRISIARIILKDSPIILLDEATSAIDPINERLIMEAVKNLGRGKTVISVAHNMESVKSSDHIILLEDGQIACQGDHDKLQKESELYREMVNAQVEIDKWTIKECV